MYIKINIYIFISLIRDMRDAARTLIYLACRIGKWLQQTRRKDEGLLSSDFQTITNDSVSKDIHRKYEIET